MAEVLSKTSLFSSWHHGRHQNRQQQGISVFPKSCNYNKSGGFSCSLKLNLPAAEMSSLSLLSPKMSDVRGNRVHFPSEHNRDKARPTTRRNFKSQASSVLNSQPVGYRIGKTLKWWEKGNQPNMKEVTSAEDLVNSLSNAGDKLVVVDFFSPGCGGCKALHPKICQLAEMNPDVEFLQVNYEQHKSMCYSLNVHVLPFFRFYRGAHGRLCSFSCTNATIKKFRDALAKHKPERCSLGPTKGLEEKELLALAANKDLSFTYTPQPVEPVPAPVEEVTVSEEALSRPKSGPLPLPSTTSKSAQVVTAWR